jgi:hypothetical protein
MQGHKNLSRPLITRKWFLACCPPACTSVCTDVCIVVCELLERFDLYFILMSLSILGQCPGNLNIPAPNSGPFKMGHTTQNGDFLKNGSNNFH